MSAFVDEIVKDIRENPMSWKFITKGLNGLEKDGILINSLGDGGGFLIYHIFSTLRIHIDGRWQIFLNLSFKDKFKLEEAYKWWTKNAPLEKIKGN